MFHQGMLQFVVKQRLRLFEQNARKRTSEMPDQISHDAALFLGAIRDMHTNTCSLSMAGFVNGISHYHPTPKQSPGSQTLIV